MTRVFAALLGALLLAMAGSGRAATEIVPRQADEVLERLPGPSVRRAPVVAAGAAPDALPELLERVRAEITLARQSGDIRHWGRAQAALATWWDKPAAPVDVAVLQATVQQGRHAFGAARTLLRDVVARAPGHAQAWLNLAALERLGADYAAALQACAAVARAGIALHGQACTQETRSLQGEHASATAALRQLAQASAAPAERSWLLSLLAEAHERAGQDAQAQSAYRESLRTAPDLYTAIAYSDLLLRTAQIAPALAVLEPLPPTDAVLLRKAAALRRAGDARWVDLRAVLQQRSAELQRRGDDPALHGREAALTALWLDDDPRQALALARRNLELQREPLDWWVALYSATQAGDAAAWQALQQQRQAAGLQDRRIDALAPPRGAQRVQS